MTAKNQRAPGVDAAGRRINEENLDEYESGAKDNTHTRELYLFAVELRRKLRDERGKRGEMERLVSEMAHGIVQDIMTQVFMNRQHDRYSFGSTFKPQLTEGKK